MTTQTAPATNELPLNHFPTRLTSHRIDPRQPHRHRKRPTTTRDSAHPPVSTIEARHPPFCDVDSDQHRPPPATPRPHQPPRDHAAIFNYNPTMHQLRQCNHALDPVKPSFFMLFLVFVRYYNT